jgi:antitoxin HigA-1
LFYLCSFRFPTGAVARYQVIRSLKDRMNHMTETNGISEAHIKAGVSMLLNQAASTSGRSQVRISGEADIDRGTMRRILAGKREPTVSEVLRILHGAGASPHAHLLLFLAADQDRAASWLQTDLALFFEELVRHLPGAMETQLGDNLHDVKPHWAGGTAKRVARLLADHIAELARKDALLGDGLHRTNGGGRE